MDESSSASALPDSPESVDVLASAPQRFIVTPTLVAMNVAYFLAMVSVGVPATTPSAMDVLPFGANFGPATINGEWWRLLTSTFVHYGLMHLGFNMWCLWSLGNLAERLFRSGPFLVIYLLTGLSGSAASLFWNPVAVSAGASGAVFGIAGALASFLYLRRIHLPERAARDLLTSIVIFITFNLAFGLAIPGIDNAGHLGGLVLGAALGAALSSRGSFPLAAGAAALAIVASAFVSKNIVQSNPTVILAEAMLIADSDRPGATEKVELAVAEHPELTAGHTLLAELYLRERRYDDAAKASRKALALDPQLANAQSSLGSALYWQGDYEAAEGELRKAIELEPKQLDAHALMSRSLRELGRQLDAMSALEEGLKYAPTPSLLFRGIGFENLDEVELDFLIASLKKEIEITPEEPEHYNVLSLVLARSGAHDEALEAVRTALELRPKAPHIIDSLGTVHFYRDELDAAVKAYRDAIELAPDYGIYQYNVSVALRRRGDDADADIALAEARRLVPNLSPPSDGTPIM